MHLLALGLLHSAPSSAKPRHCHTFIPPPTLFAQTFVRRSRPVLHVGCGNSNFQEGMAKDGYQVVNVSNTRLGSQC